MENITNNATENANVETAVETAVETKLNVETLDKKFLALGKSCKDIFTPQERETLRAEYRKRFDENWDKVITTSYLSTIRGVSTTGVVSYFAKDDKRVDDLASSIKAIGNGKPKMSEAEKAIAQLKKLGLSLDTIKTMLEK